MPSAREFRADELETPITMLTAYDAPTATVIDEAGTDIILVGDSMGNAVLGYETTVPVTLEDVQSRTAAVARSTDDALVVADMPFLSYGTSTETSVENAGRLIKDAGADAIKLECGPHTVALTETLTNLGIPVMAHLGLTPQHVNQLGYHRQGTTTEAAEEIQELAAAHEDAGAFTVVLEHIPANLAGQLTAQLDIPTIGIGAGGDTDGQVLVITDVLGLSEWGPSFSKQFGAVRDEMEDAVDGYLDAVEDGSFPGPEHSYVEPALEES